MTTAAPDLDLDVPTKHTEASMLTLLRQRHAEDKGNGPAWAYLEHVRSNAGFTRPGKTRTIDALAVHLWESRGHDVHAYEVKVSRADFRTELSKPEKADTWCAIADYFWIVAPRGIVPKEELPASWGLIETHGDGLRVTVQAKRLRDVKDRPALTRGQVVAMLRAAGAGLSTTPDQAALDAARSEGWHRGLEDAKKTGGNWQQMYEGQKVHVERAREIERQISQALGVDFHTWRATTSEGRVKEVADALRSVLGAPEAAKRAKENLERAASQLEQQAAWIRQHAGTM